MAIRFAARPEWGGLRKEFHTMTLGNYATGGFTLDGLAHVQASNILLILCDDIDGYSFYPDYANKKVKVYSTPGTELANGSSALNGKTLRYLVLYISA